MQSFQNFNWEGIKAWAAVRSEPSLAMPHVRARSIARIPASALMQAGIQYVVADLDNTIVEPHSTNVPKILQDTITEYRDVFKDRFAVISDSAGTHDDLDYKAAQAVVNELRIPVIYHDVKKPGCASTVFDYFRLDRGKHLACIGDGLLTDIVLGNRLGALTIFTQPLTDEGDNNFAVFLRKREHALLHKLDANKVRASYHSAAQKLAPFASTQGFIVSDMGTWAKSNYERLVPKKK